MSVADGFYNCYYALDPSDFESKAETLVKYDGPAGRVEHYYRDAKSGKWVLTTVAGFGTRGETLAKTRLFNDVLWHALASSKKLSTERMLRRMEKDAEKRREAEWSLPDYVNIVKRP